MKTWFFKMKRQQIITGNLICICTGVVKADTREEACDKVWDNYGGDACFGLEVYEVEDIAIHYVYKSDFPY